LRLHSPSPEATERFGAALAAAIDAAGAIVLLSGPLGAGKTRFVKGVAAGLGVDRSTCRAPRSSLARSFRFGTVARSCTSTAIRIADEAELESAGLLDWLAPAHWWWPSGPSAFPGAWPERPSRDPHSHAAPDENARTLEALARGPLAAALPRAGASGRPDEK
jgi:tRNA threonylcarbamoyladenosine biosynthesis protein TsaE